jgi:hypothetical protein
VKVVLVLNKIMNIDFPDMNIGKLCNLFIYMIKNS